MADFDTAVYSYALLASGQEMDGARSETEASMWVDDMNNSKNPGDTVEFSYKKMLLAPDGFKVTQGNIDKYRRNPIYWETLDDKTNAEVERVVMKYVTTKTPKELFTYIKRIEDNDEFKGEISTRTINKIKEFVILFSAYTDMQITEGFQSAFNPLPVEIYEDEIKKQNNDFEECRKQHEENKIALAKKYAEDTNRFLEGDKIEYLGKEYIIDRFSFLNVSPPRMQAVCNIENNWTLTIDVNNKSLKIKIK